MNKIPAALNDRIKNSIHEKLHPKMTSVIAKVFAIHTATAVVTLSVCPQFGFKAFNLPVNLMHSFMVFGLPICNFLCGLFFTLTSMIMASILLGHDEVRALRHQKMLSSAVLILTSIGFFSIMNPNLFLEFSLLWLIGAITGIVLTLETTKVLVRFH